MENKDKTKEEKKVKGVFVVIAFAIGIILGALLVMDLTKGDLELLKGSINYLNGEKNKLESENNLLTIAVEEQNKQLINSLSIISGYEDTSKTLLNQNKAIFEDLQNDREELYSCWSNVQRLDAILKLKYDWNGELY